MSIASEITRLQGAKASIKASVLAKGIGIPADVKLDEYHNWIDQLCGGVDLSYRSPLGTMQPLRNTANMYIVATAGLYRIPLVYGNGIKDGQVNAAAYTRQGDTYTADFVNHLGNTLTSPYIEQNQDCGVQSAGLLWQTSAGMIDSVDLVEGPDCKYLRFNVAAVPATNGLAVLWVKDANGDIVWSWTIWATADDLTPDAYTNHTEVEYDLMPEGLGAIWDANREHYVVPHYQWGRKDPMIPAAAYNSTTNMTVYDINGDAYAGFGTYGVANDADEGGTVRSVANSIKMPEKFFLQYDEVGYNWNNLDYFNNFWDAAITTLDDNADDQAISIKTIYDPCPVGWSMPVTRFATGFTTSGANVSSGAPTGCEVIGAFANGWTFKRNSADTEGRFWAASGSRNRTSGALGSVGTNGYWWSCAPSSRTYARYLGFNASAVFPLYNNFRASGFTVRPSRESI